MKNSERTIPYESGSRRPEIAWCFALLVLRLVLTVAIAPVAIASGLAAIACSYLLIAVQEIGAGQEETP